MAEFLSVAAGLPTVVFSAALMVVVGFWLLVLFGAAEHDTFDADVNADALHLGGVPVAVSASLFVVFGWFLSFAGSVALADTGLPGAPLLSLEATLLGASVFGSWWVTRRLVRPLARLFPDEPAPSRQDFIGLTCTIRTGRVDAGFGQAEVTARDGSTALVQVRQVAGEARAAGKGLGLGLGSTGLLYAYEESGEFFWVAPFDAALDPRG
ncbi:hypothetical protein OYE22_15155 [Streptomyces sp. 71268]|uniref:hypothetical protein n=1 Tax=Streptomyces sp. 71268 TaxID=3002640 RepID=UPI0023F9CEEC|nr:hypothetical protein [Streptomyces sp. 71268]WEV26385.1 hypothetical protein OYE22_15155 [Streptomyces sp. 71268]